MKKVRCFISFDYDHDVELKRALVAQSKKDDSPFEISDWSIKDSNPNWEEEARSKIKRSEVVIVICGKHTDTAEGVAIELEIAQEEGADYFLLAGREEGPNKKPKTAKPEDKIYEWTWDNLKRLINGKR